MDEPEELRKEKDATNLWEPVSILFLILTVLSLIAGMEAAFIVFGLLLFACVMRTQIYRFIWGSGPREERLEETSRREVEH